VSNHDRKEGFPEKRAGMERICFAAARFSIARAAAARIQFD
jgi:hypothetical protein